jgi:hypothetical protein
MCYACRPFPNCDLFFFLKQPSEEEVELRVIKSRETPAQVRHVVSPDGSDVVEVKAAAPLAAEHITFRFMQGESDD